MSRTSHVMSERSFPMLSQCNWRHLVSPEILFLIGAASANLPYLLWLLGSPVPRGYHFTITYKPLVLWILGYIAFCLGTGHVTFCMCRKTRPRNARQWFTVRSGQLRLLLWLVILAAIFQVALACVLYGTLPFWGYMTGNYDVLELNKAQRLSGFGQLGMLTLTLFTLNALILLCLVKNFGVTRRNRRLLWVALTTAAFSTLFSGKTQGFFILICFLLVGGALTGANPVNLLFKNVGLPRLSKRQMAATLLGLLFFLTLVHGFTRVARNRRHEDFSVRASFDAVAAYLSMPLINTEGQIAVAGLAGPSYGCKGLLTGLLPAKLRSSFALAVPPAPRLERTSPSGFLATPQWFLGLWGMLLFMFFIGIICKMFYIQSRVSTFCLFAYSQIAWTLIAAHTYNHFLNLLFIPLPIGIFFFLSKIVRIKHVNYQASR